MVPAAPGLTDIGLAVTGDSDVDHAQVGDCLGMVGGQRTCNGAAPVVTGNGEAGEAEMLAEQLVDVGGDGLLSYPPIGRVVSPRPRRSGATMRYSSASSSITSRQQNQLSG